MKPDKPYLKLKDFYWPGWDIGYQYQWWVPAGNEGEFTAMVEDLQKSLVKFEVPQAEQDELIGALATMHDDIVER